MYNREDLLRRARINEYDRFYTPTRIQLMNKTFVHEYMHGSRYTPFREGTYMISDVDWRNGTGRDYSSYENELTEMLQKNQVRARKPITTLALRTLLEGEGCPLKFAFPGGINLIVLPKSNKYANEVYIQYQYEPSLYVEQRSLNFKSDLHHRWFNKEKAQSEYGQDWRYLLALNYPEMPDMAKNVLYEIYEGIYTGDIEELRKGTKLYSKYCRNFTRKKKAWKETYQEQVRIKDKAYAESQKQICLRAPEGNIIRIQRCFSGPFLKKGFKFASKQEFKAQLDERFKKRKEMAEDNRQEQMQKYKGPREHTKGTPQSPYLKHQQITKLAPIDKQGYIKQETYKVRVIVPEYKYVPISGKTCLKKVKVGQTVVFKEITRDIKTKHKTIKVLQIPSSKMQLLNHVTSEVQTPKDGKKVFPIVRTLSKQLIFNESWRGKYSEFKVGDSRNTK